MYPCVNIIPHGAKETFCKAKLICVCCGRVCVFKPTLYFPKIVFYFIYLFGVAYGHIFTRLFNHIIIFISLLYLH